MYYEGMSVFLTGLPPTRTYALFISHAWQHKAEYEGVVSLLDAARGISFQWDNLSVELDYPLPTLMSLPKSYRSIVRQLDEKIKKADCLLVLDAMYVAHRGWIQSEIEAALEFGTPIIAVAPRGQERLSGALKYNATERVRWNGASIVDAVRRLARAEPMSAFAARLISPQPAAALAPPGAYRTIPSLSSLAGTRLIPPITPPEPSPATLASCIRALGIEPDERISIADLMPRGRGLPEK